jgi:3-hydroxyisobutyrate dehydrogenase-like beta-hydroxyacid dehydrogenase
MKRVLEVISKGAANSWQMENRGPTMIDDKFDFGFATDWMRKDLRICLAEGARNGATLAMTRMIEGFYGEIQAMGGGRWDSSALIRRLRRAPDR